MQSAQRRTLPARLAKQDVNEVYRGVAPIYDLWGALTETKARALCLEWAAIRDGETVLEVAVGTGLTFADILRRNPSGHTEGLDLTPAMLARAQRRAAATGAQNYSLRQGDAYALDCADRTFDVVINNFMFGLLPEADFETVLRQFRRVLKPGGRLVLVNMAHGECWCNRVWNVVYRINPAWVGGCRGVSLTGPLQALGFSGVRRQYLSQLTFPAEVVYGVKLQD
jgi:ubiquinone/menaquinone biosynthesis C-methylase UbiE